MSLHVYRESGGVKTLAVELDFNALDCLAGAFERFRLATGVRLSEYEDARLAPDHVRLLARLCDLELGVRAGPDRAVAFRAALQEAERQSAWLYLVGE